MARQLEAGGYDTATIADPHERQGRGRVEADSMKSDWTKCCATRCRNRWPTAGRSDQTKWLFALAVLITPVVVVVPLTLLNMHSICKPLDQAQRLAKAIAGGDLLSHPSARKGAMRWQTCCARPGRCSEASVPWVAQVHNATAAFATASQENCHGQPGLSRRTEQTASNAQAAVSSLSEITATVRQSGFVFAMANQLAASASTTATRRLGGGAGGVQHARVAWPQDGDIIGLIDSIALQTDVLGAERGRGSRPCG